MRSYSCVRARLLFVCAALFLVLSLAAMACGNDDADFLEVTDNLATQELLATFDANDDGTLTIGVAAAGPRDDQGYYQALVDFAEEFSAENGFAPPIVSDNIGFTQAARALSDLAVQGVDIVFVGASEIAEPLADLTKEFPDIFWYCNCGAGASSSRIDGVAQATDWGSAIHYTGGVAMGAVLQEIGGSSAVFLGCCELPFETEAYEATLLGLRSVDASFDMEYVATGEFPYDFDNSANATAALANAAAQGAALVYPYLGGALNSAALLATREGLAVFAPGPADICSRDDGINWAGSVIYDGGLYARQAFQRIISGELLEGSIFRFPTEQGLNGGSLCDPSPQAAMLVSDAFVAVDTDAELVGTLREISSAAYGSE
ncbi:MAG: hypothetical protein F4138_05645 [Acidimicrobiia bacterium]|nr:hypothetical protein [Acidimicrobiia bacterium]MYC57254.1 hypothetical protein [Acidimicrobiia bacterium]MYG94458.1 hypothetical protein [Acidimicrobiia bacterium]MYI30956.1 hypothetical protein [Acidimicrobiia bacterium]